MKMDSSISEIEIFGGNLFSYFRFLTQNLNFKAITREDRKICL